MHQQASELLKYAPNYGRYLTALLEQGSQFVVDSKLLNEITKTRSIGQRERPSDAIFKLC